MGMANSASAFWLYQKSESAFDEQIMHVGMTVNLGVNGGAFSVRCKGDRTEFMYIVSNTGATQEQADLANGSGLVKLKMRIDRGEVMEFPIYSTIQEGDYVVLAEADRKLAEQVRDARQTIALTISVNGRNFWENSFSSKGSTDVIGKVLRLCAEGAPS